jgi:hypothetical protein
LLAVLLFLFEPADDWEKNDLAYAGLRSGKAYLCKGFASARLLSHWQAIRTVVAPAAPFLSFAFVPSLFPCLFLFSSCIDHTTEPTHAPSFFRFKFPSPAESSQHVIRFGPTSPLSPVSLAFYKHLCVRPAQQWEMTMTWEGKKKKAEEESAARLEWPSSGPSKQ